MNKYISTLILVLTWSPIGCFDDDTALPSQTQQNISASGGTLETAEITLKVPSGALAQDTQISVTTLLDATTPVPAVEMASPVYRFEPAGLHFEQPVEISIALTTPPSEAQGLVVYWTTEDDPNTFEVLTTTLRDGHAVAYIEHFSRGFAGLYPLACSADSDCPSGLACLSGTCQQHGNACPSGQADCNGLCTDLAGDSLNCGACGQACATGQTCVNGACTTSTATCSANNDCASGEVCVNGACTTSNPTACTADSDCAAGQHCVNGACTAGGTCSAGFADCDGDPANACEASLTTDPNHCGACGQVCPAGQACADGVCTTNATSCAANSDCASGQVCVNGTCTTNNPGTCTADSDCAAGERCVNGACSSGGTCSAGYVDCDGDPANGCEVSLNTDPNHCGACGQACPAGQACADGVCTAGSAACTADSDCASGELCVNGACMSSGGTCSAGYVDCDGDPANGCEADLSSDPNHCGGCAQVCLAGQVCSGGVCVP